MTNKIEVTQADRDAAAAYMKLIGDTRWSVEGILNGGCDNTSVTQAFAAHRTRNDAQVQGLVSALEHIEEHATSPREMVEIAAEALAAWEGQQ